MTADTHRRLTLRLACPHKRGEYRHDYRHCLDCGMEWVLIGGNWHVVEAWVRVHTSLLGEEADHGATT
jgi:hypothetical protein